MNPFDLVIKFLVLIGIMEPIEERGGDLHEDYEASQHRKYRFKSFVNREKHIQAEVVDNASADFEDEEWGDC